VKKILIVNGPNLNLLGTREPEIYKTSWDLKKLEEELKKEAHSNSAEIVFFQSNSEAELIEFIQKEAMNADGLIINPGGLTHTSVSLRDAILATKIKTVEVHISNIFKREEFRKTSYFSDISEGVITGLGISGYFFALDFFIKNKF